MTLHPSVYKLISQMNQHQKNSKPNLKQWDNDAVPLAGKNALLGAAVYIVMMIVIAAKLDLIGSNKMKNNLIKNKRRMKTSP